MKTLKNPSLVNESVTSEMNLSLKAIELLQTSISKSSASKRSSRHNTAPSSNVTKLNKAAMELRMRNMFSSPKFKVEKEEVKPSEDQQSNILSKKSELNLSKRARAELLLLKMLTPQKPKLEQLDTSLYLYLYLLYLYPGFYSYAEGATWKILDLLTETLLI